MHLDKLSILLTEGATQDTCTLHPIMKCNHLEKPLERIRLIRNRSKGPLAAHGMEQALEPFLHEWLDSEICRQTRTNIHRNQNEPGSKYGGLHAMCRNQPADGLSCDDDVSQPARVETPVIR